MSHQRVSDAAKHIQFWLVPPVARLGYIVHGVLHQYAVEQHRFAVI